MNKSALLKQVALCEPQLVIADATLPPGGEWIPGFPGWMVAHVSVGVGYWLHRSLNCELATGSIVLLADRIQGCIRASQVGPLQLHFFRVEPGKLTGLVTMADQNVLESAARDEKRSLRIFPPNQDFSGKIMRLSVKETAKTLPTRTQLLQLFLDLLGGEFRPGPTEDSEISDARQRLRLMLEETLVDDVTEIDFNDLVNKTGCSPRHVSRLFTELMGVSFREKQTELRLARACDLLATTDFKVAVVAMESGYQSTSFFNLMFKQRFGVNPTRWRELARRGKPARRLVRSLRAVA